MVQPMPSRSPLAAKNKMVGSSGPGTQVMANPDQAAEAASQAAQARDLEQSGMGYL